MAIVTKYVLPICFAVSVLIMTFVVGFEMIIFNDAYFEWHYSNRDITETTGMTVEDLMYVTDEMLDYLKDRRADLVIESTVNGESEIVFGQREQDHMIDVKGLYIFVRNARRVSSVMIAAIVIFGAFYSKKTLYYVFSKMKYIIGSLMVFIVILGGLFATDFDKYFTMFHEVFFSNDLWLLDPRTDILINMVPESYFYSIVMIGVGLFIAMVIIAVILAERLKKKFEY